MNGDHVVTDVGDVTLERRPLALRVPEETRGGGSEAGDGDDGKSDETHLAETAMKVVVVLVLRRGRRLTMRTEGTAGTEEKGRVMRLRRSFRRGFRHLPARRSPSHSLGDICRGQKAL